MEQQQEVQRGTLLKRYSKLALSDANEAETRLKLIDKVLMGLLGWTPEDVSVEERVSEDGRTSFADYILRTANTALLVEAKRIGATFELGSSRRRRTLSGPLVDGITGDAIKQARDYCRKKSIPYAVVTNGAQWIVFPAVRTDEVSFNSSSAIVFDSLETLLGEDYEYFHFLLSRDSVINGNLEIELVGRNADQFEERRLNSFYATGTGTRVNPIYPLIETDIVTAFSEAIAEGDPDLLEKCYVSTPDRTKFDNRINMHLAKRAPLFDKKPATPMGGKRKRGYQEGGLEKTLHSARKAVRPLAVLVLGSVGAGKTTFIRYTRLVTARDFFSERKDVEYPHWIYVDFREYAREESALGFLVSAIKDYFADDDFFSHYDRAIRSAYKRELDALLRGPLAPIAKNQDKVDEKISELIQSDYVEGLPYVEKLLKYAASKVPVFLVVDNVDQFEDEGVQSTVFGDAIAFARKAGVNLILAMRETTFVRHRRTPTFDAFDYDPIQLEPPQIKQVLSRRFFVAESLLKGKSGTFIAPNGADFEVKDLSVFMSIVRSSVLGTEVGNTIEMLAEGDVRLALAMTRAFLERGYTDPAKAIQNHSAGRSYTLPKHEALRAILLSNQPVYTEEYSVIGNIFDSRLDKTQAQLLRLCILAALVRHGTQKDFDYLSGPAIRDATRAIGFPDDHVLRVLGDLCKLRFAHTASHGEAEFGANFFASRLGGYLLRVLISQFAFIENMAMDTFIASDDVWRDLWDKSQQVREERDTSERLRLRISRVKSFFEYMIDLYRPIVEEARRRGLPAEWCTNPLEEAKDHLWSDCDRALRSAKRLYGTTHSSSSVR